MEPIETLDLRNISEPDARAIAKLVCAIWPKPGRTVDSLTTEILARWRNYRGLESHHPRSFIVRDGGQVVAHAGAAPRTIGTSTGDITVLALARVCTAPAARGRHLGQAVARAAFQLVDNGTYPFALFQTNEPVKPFYDRLGAIVVQNRFINSLGDDPEKPPFWDKYVMRYPDIPGWPEGNIDLRGPGW
jgi:hypothetical protein